MVKGKKKVVITSTIVCMFALLVSALLWGKISINKAGLSAEMLKEKTYGELTKKDAKIDNCEFVQFSAFFTRDLDNDGYAERIKGTCKEIGSTDTLYAELNVLTKGSLKNGKITLNAENFTWTTSIVEDNVVSGDYIGETNSINLKQEVQNGNQKLLWGTIKSKIGSDVSNYSKQCSMTLTGTYDDGEGHTTEISKTVNLTVDWYGETETAVNKYYYSQTGYSNYQNQMYDISTVPIEDEVELTFKVAVSEVKRQLLLQKQELKLTIPDLNGQPPKDAVVLDRNVQYEYNPDTKILTITRESTKEEESNSVTQEISNANINTIKVTYPREAYEITTANSIVLNIPIEGDNYGYNNTSTEFEHPHHSSDIGTLTITYSKPSGDIWNIYATVGNYERSSSSSSYRYQVSKEAPTSIYNGQVYEDLTTTYPVGWEVVVGDYTAISKITLEEQNLDEESVLVEDNEENKKENKKSDQFLNTSSQYSSMHNYIRTTGIYFRNVLSALGNDGWIELYNAESGSLIEKLTSSTCESYTKEKPYSVDLKSIKIVTSNPISNTSFTVYQLKEMDDELLTSEINEEDFKDFSYIYTYLKGQIQAPNGITYDSGKETSEIEKNASANYEMPFSVAKINIDRHDITNQKTENVNLTIQTLSKSTIEKKWINGTFVIELPENIINANIKEVKSSDENVQVSSSEEFEKNGRYFIKIHTTNQEEAIYNITINADITANPLKPTENKEIRLYSYNENCNNYDNKSQDIYDLDADGSTEDFVGCESTSISTIAPSGLLTTEYVTDYDDLGSTTIAPNVADIEKSSEVRTATINVSITNSYVNTISDIVILGKTPFEDNSYVINGEKLNSEYTAHMTGAIKVPEGLEDSIEVYYSTNENTTNDLSNGVNGWVSEDSITNWGDVRTYLIVFGDYRLVQKDNQVFRYEVEVPAGLGYNSASFSNHAVYYNLDTENGKIATETEPNKVGIQVVSKYNMQLTKNKNKNDKIFVRGATYSITTTDKEGNEITKSETTDENGILKFSGIYVDREYTLKEVSSPNDYVLSDDVVKFKAEIVEENGIQRLAFTKIDGNLRNDAEVTYDDNKNFLVKVNVEDEAKYTLKINKTDENGKQLENIKFIINGKDKPRKVYKTDEAGTFTLTGLYLNEKYEIQEIKADGYYVDQEPCEFKLIRDEEGTLVVQTDNDKLKNATIDVNSPQALVTININNEKIPTYTLQVIKVEEDTDEDDISKLKPLTGASFKLVSEDSGIQKEYTVDENGSITVPGLYEFVDGKYITGNYTLQETKAPDGYSNNAEEINFKATRNDEGKLQIIVENEKSITSFKSAIVEDDTVKIFIQDKPMFRITKTDSETNEPLENAQFIIYELNENGSQIDFAKDVNGSYVGEKNQFDEYIVTTDKNGVISLPLRKGIYRIIEVGYPDGYQENSNVQIFKVGGIDSEDLISEKDIIEINYIEDLVELSNQVNAGDDKSDKIIRLMRTLDFQADESYRDISNKDKKNFKSIGNSSNPFSGIFDGQGKEIKNIRVTSNSGYTGLFGYLDSGEINDLKVSGNIIDTALYSGGIVGRAKDSRINNCYNSVDINIKTYINGSGSRGSSYIGGIAGGINNCTVSDCYNSGNMINEKEKDYSYTGGIIGSTNKSDVNGCYNKGTIKDNTTGYR